VNDRLQLNLPFVDHRFGTQRPARAGATIPLVWAELGRQGQSHVRRQLSGECPLLFRTRTNGLILYK